MQANAGLGQSKTVQLIIALFWLAWLVYWWLSARDVKPARWCEPAASQLTHRIPLILGVLLYAAPSWFPTLSGRFLPWGRVFPIVGLVLVAAGLGLSMWARRHLGRNWSASVVVKEDHALIRSGPYRRVRHPIYSGMLLAFLGMTLAIGEWRALIGLALVIGALVRKGQVEEGRMRETFPDYVQYARETNALVPYLY